MSGETINVTVTARQYIAAVTAAWIAGRPADPEALAAYPATPDAWLQSVVDSACKSYEAQFKANFIPLPEVMIRLANIGKLETILSLAQTNAELGAYWEKVKAAGGIWSGSADSLSGTAALVAAEILTQEQADALLYYPMPELPE